MIKYKIGDILKALESGEIDILGHGVNCSGGFGSGIAGQIRNEHPKVTAEFLKRSFSLGDLQIVQVDFDKFIANLATQEKYGNDGGKYVSYDGIYNSLTKLKEYCIMDRLTVGIPKIGAGLAGGNWNIIKAIIEEVFSDYDITIYSLKEK